MDDVYVSSKADRTEAIHCGTTGGSDAIMARKQAEWPQRGGDRLTAAARRSDPSVVVWKGDPSLPASEQGLRILGTPLRHPEDDHDQLRRTSVDNRWLLERIPAVQDLQSAWLLLSLCAGTHANCLLRATPPQMALEFAANHTVSLRTCLQRILGAEIPAESSEVAVLPFTLGRLGLRSELAKATSRQETPLFKKRAEQAWRLRWAGIFGCAAPKVVATSMLELKVAHGADGDVPSCSEVLADHRYDGLAP